MLNKPIKRNENIASFSRDHHFGLLFCWKIRQGLKNEIELQRIRQYINYFWQLHLKDHFNEEETILFSLVKDRLCEKGFLEHKEIAELISAINGDRKNDQDAYATLAILIDHHIRFEERNLFPFLESVLSEEDLAAVGKQLRNIHSSVKADKYADEFWVEK